MTEREAERYLVLAGESDEALVTALRRVRDEARERDVPAAVDIVVGTADRAGTVPAVVARVDLPESMRVRTAVVDDAETYVRESERVSRVFLDPRAVEDPGAFDDPSALDGAGVEHLATGRDVRRRALMTGGRRTGFVVVFALSYGFYLLLGDPTDPFDIVTGAVTAGLVATALSSVVVEPGSSLSTVAVRGLRATIFLPYLGYEIVKANLGVAYVILHPALPIDPRTVTYDPDTDGGFERAVLANAITLTPGTLTVDVDGDGLRVHTLTEDTRAGLEAGSLARAVAWVFHGRDR